MSDLVLIVKNNLTWSSLSEGSILRPMVYSILLGGRLFNCKFVVISSATELSQFNRTILETIRSLFSFRAHSCRFAAELFWVAENVVIVVLNSDTSLTLCSKLCVYYNVFKVYKCFC